MKKMKDRVELRSADLKGLKLGRYPWRAGVKYYIAKREPYLSSSTIDENTRKLLMLGRVLTDLKEDMMVKTTEHFYAQIREGEIEHEIGNAWRENPIQ